MGIMFLCNGQQLSSPSPRAEAGLFSLLLLLLLKRLLLRLWRLCLQRRLLVGVRGLRGVGAAQLTTPSRL